MKYYKSKIKYIRVKDDTLVDVYYKTDGKSWWNKSIGEDKWYKIHSKPGVEMFEISEAEAFIEIL